VASKNHITIGQANGRHPSPHCLGCKRPIFYGERCEGCKRELRKRQRRKPR
jgi:hypothetical protein